MTQRALYTRLYMSPTHGGRGGTAELGKLAWGEHWSSVTTRHLLAQVTGRGAAPPGTRFDYDSHGVGRCRLNQWNPS